MISTDGFTLILILPKRFGFSFRAKISYGYAETEPFMMLLEKTSRLLKAYDRTILASGSCPPGSDIPRSRISGAGPWLIQPCLTKVALEPRNDSGISFPSIFSDFVHIACINHEFIQLLQV